MVARGDLGAQVGRRGDGGAWGGVWSAGGGGGGAVGCDGQHPTHQTIIPPTHTHRNQPQPQHKGARGGRPLDPAVCGHARAAGAVRGD
jgi:hypothetical protein